MPPLAYIQTHWDKVPIYGSDVAHKAADFAGTDADAVVQVPKGKTVVVPEGEVALAKYVIVLGRLDVHGELRCHTLTVPARSNIYTQTGTLTFTGGPFEDYDPLQFGRGLVIVGKAAVAGVAKSGVANLDAHVRGGTREVRLRVAPVGWQPGDVLAFPDTRRVVNPIDHAQAGVIPGSIGEQVETALIESVNGRDVMLSSPLQFTHLKPFVFNLTRSAVIRSADAANRGHILLLAEARASFAHAELHGLGRTTVAPIGPGNQIGRYCLHAHHLHGSLSVKGCAGIGHTDPEEPIENICRWGVALHDTHRQTAKDNVWFNFPGSAVVTEQGNETDNRIEKNYAVLCRGSGEWLQARAGNSPLKASGDKLWINGSGFGFNSAANKIRDNYAINCQLGIGVAGHGGDAGIPLVGEDGQTSLWRFDQHGGYPPGMEGNVAYWCGVGMETWNVPSTEGNPTGEFTAVGCSQGILVADSPYTYLHWLVTKDCEWCVTFKPGYELGGVHLDRCELGGRYGYRMIHPLGSVAWTRCKFDCTEAAIYLPRGVALRMPAAHRVEGCLFAAPAWVKSENGTYNDGAYDFHNSDSPFHPTTWEWKNVNGKSFRLYLREQERGWVIPDRHPFDPHLPWVYPGFAEGGLTNAEYAAKHGAPMLGEFAPDDAAVWPEFGEMFLVGVLQ